MPFKNYLETIVQIRFGGIIPDELWGIIPDALYHHQKELGLTVGHVWLCVYVLNHKRTREWPTVSMTKLCMVSGVPVTTILEYIKDLEGMGYLCREPGDSRGGNPKTFDLFGLKRALERAVMRAAKKGRRDWLRSEDQVEERVF